MPILKPVRGCYFIRWLHAGYYKDVAALEYHSRENFLTESDIRERMPGGFYGYGGHVITEINKPVGSVMYRLHKKVLNITNLVIHQDYRRRGLATLLLERLANCKNWQEMSVFVRDSNLDAHLFFKHSGFEAMNVEQNYFSDGDDAYHFRKEKK